MKYDFDRQFQNTVDSLKGGKRPKLLLHCCCAPCTSGVLPQLVEAFDVCCFYYNPNTEPHEEYVLRLDELKKYLLLYDYSVPLIVSDYANGAFKAVSRGLEMEKEGGARCSACIGLRLAETAKVAANNGFEYFATTLSVSPMKNAAVINTLGVALEKGYNVKYLVSDFKKRDGYKRSVDESEKYGLYRQNYCGCLYGKNNKE